MKAKNLFIFGLVFMFLISFVSALTAPTGGVSYWNFSSTTDLWGSNDATNYGATSVTDFPSFNISGNSGPNSFNFNNQVVTIPHDSSLNLVGDSALSLWVKASSDPRNWNGYIFNKATSTAEVDINFYSIYSRGDSNQLYFRIRIGSTSRNIIVSMPFEYYNLDWVNFVLLRDGSSFKVYINSELKGSLTSPGSMATSSNDIQIGKVSTLYFRGLIDEVKIFDSALNILEIQNLYNYGNIEGLRVSNFTITAQDIYTNASISNFSATIDGVTYFSNGTGEIVTHLLYNSTELYNIEIFNVTGYFDRTFNNINVSENFVAQLYPFFKVFVIDAITGDALNNISVRVDGSTYTTTTGEVQIPLITDETLTKILFVWALDGPGYFNKTIKDQIIGRNLTVELYKKNSVLIQTYWENGTKINNEFDVRFTSDLPTTFLTSTNATGGLFYNNLSIASWKIDVFNSTIPLRSYYVDVEDFSFTKLNVYFPLPDNQQAKTFRLEDSLKNIIEDGLITFTKFVDDAYVSLGQIKTDSTGTESFILNNGVAYRLIIEADGFETKIFNIVANIDTTTYTIVLLTDTLINFTTVFDKFTFSVDPIPGVIAAINTNFTLTTSSSSSVIEWFYLKSGAHITNVSGSPAGGAAIITLDLNNTANQRVLVEYGVKVQGFEEYQFSNNYFVYVDINLSSSLGGAREDVIKELEGNIILGAFLSAFIILILSFLFPVDQIKGTKSLNGLGVLVSVSVFAWFGLFPLLISILVGTLTLLSIIGGGQ